MTLLRERKINPNRETLEKRAAAGMAEIRTTTSLYDLLRRTGVFAPFLDLTIACESGDEAAFAKAADALHLSNRQVNWAHLQALTWAESLNEE